MGIVGEWVKENNIDSDRPKLLTIIKQAEGPVQKKLAEQRGELLRMIKHLSRINRDNVALLDTSLDYMDTFLRLLTGEEETDIYAQQASSGSQKKKISSRVALVDKQA